MSEDMRNVCHQGFQCWSNLTVKTPNTHQILLRTNSLHIFQLKNTRLFQVQLSRELENMKPRYELREDISAAKKTLNMESERNMNVLWHHGILFYFLSIHAHELSKIMFGSPKNMILNTQFICTNTLQVQVSLSPAKAPEGSWLCYTPVQPCERALCRAALNQPAARRAVGQRPLRECRVSLSTNAIWGSRQEEGKFA